MRTCRVTVGWHCIVTDLIASTDEHVNKHRRIRIHVGVYPIALLVNRSDVDSESKPSVWIIRILPTALSRPLLNRGR
jgi:hypothetical protein